MAARWVWRKLPTGVQDRVRPLLSRVRPAPAAPTEPIDEAAPASTAAPPTDAAAGGADPTDEVAARERWVVGPGVAGSAGERRWVTFDVDGQPVRFEVDGLPLATRPEVALTAFAVPAAEQHAGLAAAEPVDPGWRAGVEGALALMAPWWGADADLDLTAPEGQPRPATGATGVGQCFTAGVDSFWSLLRGDHEATHLVTVFGFDIDLDDRERIADTTAAVQAVADARGLTAVFVRTDLRSHHRFAPVSWEHTHGAALAAVGLVLSEVLGTLVVPPSYAEHRLVPWGSRPDLDPRWSVPGSLEVTSDAAVLTRRQRIAAIADEPLVHQHLRVCWEHLGPGANCGRCEKCLCTQALFAATDHLDDLQTFPHRDELVERIDALPTLRPGLSVLWSDVIDDLAPQDLQDATRRLLERSPR